ncbi:MAG: TonB-dependent receptor [Nitrospira sp.]|nr:TonB-dependent receptor [Nitrospira sp.]
MNWISAQLTPGWNILTGYATDAEVTKDNDTSLFAKHSANVPYNKFTLWSTYHIQEGLLQGFGVGGGLFAYTSRNASIFGDQTEMPGYIRADGALYYNHDLQKGNWLGARSRPRARIRICWTSGTSQLLTTVRACSFSANLEPCWPPLG